MEPDTEGQYRVIIPHILRHPSRHLLALCRPLLPAPWLVTRSTQQPVASLWNVSRLDVRRSRATARCVALAFRTSEGKRPAYHRASLATAALQPLGSSADGVDTVPTLPQLA